MNNDDKWGKIRKGYQKGMSYADLEKMYKIKASTIKTRRNREKWQRGDNPITTTIPESMPVIDKDLEEAEDLTAKERRFVELYLQTRNIQGSYRKAFGEMPRNVMQPQNLLKKPRIKEYMHSLQQQITEHFGIGIESLLLDVLGFANADVMDFVDIEHGVAKLKPVDEITADTRAIQSISTNAKTGSVTINLVDKLSAIDKLISFFNKSKLTELNAEQLKKIKLENQVLEAQLRSLTIDGGSGVPNSIIINDKNEMRRLLEERQKYQKLEEMSKNVEKSVHDDQEQKNDLTE